MAVWIIISWESSSIIYKANERSEYDTYPKNTPSSRDRRATMCVCMSVRTSQRTRSVIIYCPVNLDLLTETNCLEQTRRRWNPRSIWGVWLALREGVGGLLSTTFSWCKGCNKRHVHWDKVCVCANAKKTSSITAATVCSLPVMVGLYRAKLCMLVTLSFFIPRVACH